MRNARLFLRYTRPVSSSVNGTRIKVGSTFGRGLSTSTPGGGDEGDTDKIVPIVTPNFDPLQRKYKFWNREEAKEPGKFAYLLGFSPESIVQEARILSLSDVNDDANKALHNSSGEGKYGLPEGSRLVGIGTTLEDFDAYRDSQPNVLFVSPSCPRAASVLPLVLAAFPSIQWVHVRSAGIDFVESDDFADIVTKRSIQVTNAKGQFSSSLAEVRT